MGSRFFATCQLGQRFRVESPFVYQGAATWKVYDWDQRRMISVSTPSWNRKDHDDEGREFVRRSVAQFIDDTDKLPADAFLASISTEGVLSSTSSHTSNDNERVPVYPSRADFPLHAAVVRRCDLVEHDRLGLLVDLTARRCSAPNDASLFVFKYFMTIGNRCNFWNEANCVLRMPPHPNIVPFEALVVEAVNGDDKVVGFLTRYVAGETLYVKKNRVFKLKYLEQLIDAVDYLNLQLGIVHGDICPWNLLIDAETDSIQLFDFNSSAKLGWDGDEEGFFAYDHERNDVKFVIFTLYEIITRAYEDSFRSEYYPHELDEGKLLRKRTWTKHPDTQLDQPVTAYRRVLKEWTERRKKTDGTIQHFSQAAEPLEWPPVPGGPTYYYMRGSNDAAYEFHANLVREGRDMVRWQRPPTRALPLPKGRELLATGEIVEGA